jgi:hypothetical protein
MALGKVYPSVRHSAPKNRKPAATTEFWMVEPEVAYGTLDDNHGTRRKA